MCCRSQYLAVLWLLPEEDFIVCYMESANQRSVKRIQQSHLRHCRKIVTETYLYVNNVLICVNAALLLLHVRVDVYIHLICLV